VAFAILRPRNQFRDNVPLVTEGIHSYAQLSFPGQMPRPDRVMTVDAHRAAGTGVHLMVSDMVISGDFELHLTLTSTQAAHLASRLDEVTRKAHAPA
jgi:hypothetical protein